MFKIVDFALFCRFTDNQPEIRKSTSHNGNLILYSRLILYSKNGIRSYSAEKALYRNVENAPFRHIRPDCRPLRQKVLPFTKIQIILQIRSEFQNYFKNRSFQCMFHHKCIITPFPLALQLATICLKFGLVQMFFL